MRFPSPFAFLALLAVAALAIAADEPVPLLKPVVPTNNTIRVRIAVADKTDLADSVFKAQIPLAKKKNEMADVVVALDTIPGKSNVAAKKWRSWGFEVPANRIGILPELVIPAVQLAPKAGVGKDVQVKLTNIPLEIVDPPANGDLVYGCDLYIRINDITKNAERTVEPRYYFTDHSLELTVPSASIKRLDGGGGTPLDTSVNPDATLVPFASTMVVRGAPMFTYASINGLTQYKTSEGKTEPVNIAVSSHTNWIGGIMMTLGAARGCGVEMDNEKEKTGVGTNFKTTVGKGKVKEFRLGFLTGPGFKTPKDLVLKDATVYVDKTNSGHFIWLGAKFVNEQFPDAIYSCGSDNVWRLHGRVKPELLQDIKTRMPPPK